MTVANFITSCMASMPQITVGGDVNITFNGGDGVLLIVILLVVLARTKRQSAWAERPVPSTQGGGMQCVTLLHSPPPLQDDGQNRMPSSGTS